MSTTNTFRAEYHVGTTMTRSAKRAVEIATARGVSHIYRAVYVGGKCERELFWVDGKKV